MGYKINDQFIQSIMNRKEGKEFSVSEVNMLNQSFFGKKIISKKEMTNITVNGIKFEDYLTEFGILGEDRYDQSLYSQMLYAFFNKQYEDNKHLYIKNGNVTAELKTKKPSLPWYVSFVRFFNKNAYREQYNRYTREMNAYNKLKDSIAKEFKPSKIAYTKETTKPIIEKDKKIDNNINIIEPIKEKGFNRNPKRISNIYQFDRSKENSEAEYANKIMANTTGLDLCKENVDIILLASFNIQELSELKEYIKDMPEFNDYKRAIDFKLNILNDDTEIEKGPNLLFGTGYKKMEKRQEFVCRQLIGGMLIDDINKILDKKIDIYNSMGTNVEQISKDYEITTSVFDRLAIKNIVEKKSLNQSDGVNKFKIKEDDSKKQFVLNMPPTEKQTTGNGCWSCSFGMLLKSYDVIVNQTEIRGYRPDFSLNNVPDNDLLAKIHEKMNFAYRATIDETNTIEDYSDLATKTIKNCSVCSAQLYNSPDTLLDLVTKTLKKTKAPICLFYQKHYRTIIGVENGHLILEDSIIDPKKGGQYRYPKENYNYYKNKYPNNSVVHVNSFNNNIEQMVGLTWIEQIKDPSKTDFYDEKIHKDFSEPQESFLRKETLSFTSMKWDQDEKGVHSVQYEVQLPKSYVKEVYKTKNMDYKFDNEIVKEENKVDKKENNKIFELFNEIINDVPDLEKINEEAKNNKKVNIIVEESNVKNEIKNKDVSKEKTKEANNVKEDVKEETFKRSNTI